MRSWRVSRMKTMRRSTAGSSSGTSGRTASRLPSTTSAISTSPAGSHESVTAAEIDRLLGSVLQEADSSFNRILELGFVTAIRKEWAWREKRGEPLTNLAAFAHLAAPRQANGSVGSAAWPTPTDSSCSGTARARGMPRGSSPVGSTSRCPNAAQPGRGAAGRCSEQDLLPDIVHTSLLRRAIQTANATLDVAEAQLDPVRRSWRLNSVTTAHYRARTRPNPGGVRRRPIHAVAPVVRHPAAARCPMTTSGRRWATSFADLPPEAVPRTECLADVVVRMRRTGADGIVPDLRTGAAYSGRQRSARAQAPRRDERREGHRRNPTGIPLLAGTGRRVATDQLRAPPRPRCRLHVRLPPSPRRDASSCLTELERSRGAHR